MAWASPSYLFSALKSYTLHAHTICRNSSAGCTVDTSIATCARYAFYRVAHAQKRRHASAGVPCHYINVR
eukprot:9346570-Pyramimonas_sp.AAC.1